MRFIIRTVMLIALVWIGLLLSGYGVLIGSKENAAGLGLQCTYLTATMYLSDRQRHQHGTIPAH